MHTVFIGQMMRKTILSISLLISCSAHAVEPLPHALHCEKQWIQDSASFATSTPADRITKWKTHEGECKSTSVYWGRLAILQANAHEFKAARESIIKAPKENPEYDFALDLARLEIEVQRRLASPAPLARTDIEKFEEGYQRIVREHPKWPTGYALLGGTQTMLGKHSQAVASLRKASEGDAYQLSGVFRNLAISLTALGKHEEALAAADRAGKLDKSLLGDPAFAIAVANSHTALGYIDDAQNLLKVVLAKRPELKADPEFIEAVEYTRRAKKTH